MSPGFVNTTDPMPVPARGSWRERYDRMRGIEPPRKITPGLMVFIGNPRREKAALYHNTALEAGYRSELEGLAGFTHVHVAPPESDVQ